MVTLASDFRGTYPLRWIAPMINVATWVCLLAGPFLFRFPWLCVVAAYQGVYALLGIGQVVRARIGWVRTRSVLRRYEAMRGRRLPEREEEDGDDPEANIGVSNELVFHAFVIPNYKEPRELLQSTLQYLSRHPLAKKRYIVLLAMEEAEEGHRDKADFLLDQFHESFASIHFTTHRLQQGEMKGKASNVSWAVERLVETLTESGKENEEKLLVTTENVLVTVLDADAWIHSFYIDELNRVIAADRSALKNRIFAPPIIFERNWRDTASATRIQDFCWAALAFQNLNGRSGIGFPLSVYSIPLRVCIDVGYWDTNPESIAEDMHMFLKAFFKTQAKIRLEPIYVAANLVNLQDDTLFKTMNARFFQAERHYRGVVDVPYALRQFFSLKPSMASFIALGKTLEAHILPPTAPFFMMLAGPYCQLLHWTGHRFAGRDFFLVMWTQAFGALGLLILIGVIVPFEQMRRRTNKIVYDRENPSPWYFLYYIWIANNVWQFLVVPYVLAGFRWLLPFGHGHYRVAEKKVKTSQNLDTPSSDARVAPREGKAGPQRDTQLSMAPSTKASPIQ